jgi:hypothetical protein
MDCDVWTSAWRAKLLLWRLAGIMSQLCPREKQKSEKITKQNKTSTNVIVIIGNAQGAQGSTPSWRSKRDSWGLSRQTQTPPFLVGAKELLPTHRRRAQKASWSPLPWMCVQAWQGMCSASMCQTCMSPCTIDTSSWAATASCFLGAEKALPGARGLHDAPCSPGWSAGQSSCKDVRWTI